MGLLSYFLPFRYFPNFSALSKHTLAIEYHVNIWQVLPQLSCADTCQIWMWFKESKRYFCNIENFAYGEINERSFSNPHSRPNSRLCDIKGIYYSCDQWIPLTKRQYHAKFIWLLMISHMFMVTGWYFFTAICSSVYKKSIKAPCYWSFKMGIFRGDQ